MMSDEKAARVAELEREIRELRAVIKAAWAMMDSGLDNPNRWNTVLARLPAGGVDCEHLAEEVADMLRAFVPGLDEEQAA